LRARRADREAHADRAEAAAPHRRGTTQLPGWETFEYDPSIFAPLTDEQMKAEGWDQD
jgi:hypothetical protein